MSDLPSLRQTTLWKRTDALEHLSHNWDIWNFLEGGLWDHPQTPHGRGTSQGFAVTCDEASKPINNKRLYVSENNPVYGKYWGET